VSQRRLVCRKPLRVAGFVVPRSVTVNRHQRRADLRAFKREAERDHLVTHLVAANAPLDHYPLLSRAVSFWRSGIQQRRPFCPACRANYADGAHAAAFLFAMPSIAPTSASVTAFCDQCWK